MAWALRYRREMHLVRGVALFLSLVCASPALACSLGTRSWLQPDGVGPVPTNVRIWLYVESLGWWEEPPVVPETSFWLQDSAGARVPADLSQVTLRGAQVISRVLYVLTPREHLAATSSYVVHTDGEEVPGSLTLTTSDGPDLDPPVPTSELDRDSYTSAGSSCGDITSVTISYVPSEDPGTFVITALDDYDSLDIQTWSGTAHAVRQPLLDPEEVWDVGYSSTDGTWPEGAGRTVHNRFGTFDLAGNFSGFSSPSEVQLPKLPEEGCSSLGPSRANSRDASLWALVLVALIALSRIRSRQRSTKARSSVV